MGRVASLKRAKTAMRAARALGAGKWLARYLEAERAVLACWRRRWGRSIPKGAAIRLKQDPGIDLPAIQPAMNHALSCLNPNAFK